MLIRPGPCVIGQYSLTSRDCLGLTFQRRRRREGCGAEALGLNEHLG